MKNILKIFIGGADFASYILSNSLYLIKFQSYLEQKKWYALEEHFQ